LQTGYPTPFPLLGGRPPDSIRTQCEYAIDAKTALNAILGYDRSVTTPDGQTRRQRKRARTRAAIIDAATDMFETRGYGATTVADIAAAADIGTRTFFDYFASKDELLFPEVDARVLATVDAIATRSVDDRPADVLLRALQRVVDADRDLTARSARLRMHVVATVPAVRGRALQLQLDAQREIARHLVNAYPDELDAITAGALVGAFVGAVSGAVQAMIDAGGPTDTETLHTAVWQAARVALRPWQS
jgi:AcrR family transcriptional regulator